MANDSEYGLGGAVWSKDINRCLRVSNALETGRVWVNCYNRLPAGAPFGGYKTSGIGRENPQDDARRLHSGEKHLYLHPRRARGVILIGLLNIVIDVEKGSSENPESG